MWITKGKKWLYGIASFCTLPGKEQVAEKFPSQEIEDKKSTVRMTSNALILIPRKESEHCSACKDGNCGVEGGNGVWSCGRGMVYGVAKGGGCRE
ncbi:hypothetical protein L3X38_023484 [Prunus dulcis]|uniref:Uncharacterized protein n=1 Tax=Prunus dulcis TaxID=3755 RepID=A0AAD4Z644_PRUDU|nr:hypothetical protein L3X38_023484 [Prunus dulcis]